MIGLGALLGLLAVVFLVTRFDQLGSGDTVDVQVGPQAFSPGQAADLVDVVNEQPLLFQDAARGDRDIWLQHLGDDPDEGWLAFSVRGPDTADRACFADWVPDDRTFVDTCDGTVYPETGEGLDQYQVTVDGDGVLTITFTPVE